MYSMHIAGGADSAGNAADYVCMHACMHVKYFMYTHACKMYSMHIAGGADFSGRYFIFHSKDLRFEI